MGGKKIKRVLALSGGGAHTISYVGMWKMMHDEHSFVPDMVTGTSGGALFGCFIAAGIDGKTIEKELIKLEPWKYLQFTPLKWFFNFAWSWGMIDIEKIRRIIKNILDEYGINWNSFKKTEYRCVVADLTDGKRKYVPTDFEMELDSAIAASIAIPGVFYPLKYPSDLGKIHYFVDGGLCEGFPIKAALENNHDNTKIMALTPFDPDDNIKDEIIKLKDYFQVLYLTLNNDQKRDMMDLLDREKGDVCIYSGSIAKNALDFSKSTIKKNVKVGYKNAKINEKLIKEFFKS